MRVLLPLLVVGCFGLAPRARLPAPARLPAYDEPTPPSVAALAEPKRCVEHAQPAVLKKMLRGGNAGREYWGCANELPCEHFEWLLAAPVKQPIATVVEEEGGVLPQRLAGDALQGARVVAEVDTAAAADQVVLNGTLSRILFRGDEGFTVARLAPVGPSGGSSGGTEQEALYADADAAIGTGANAGELSSSSSRKKKHALGYGVRAAGCLATARVGERVSLRGAWITHPRFGRQFEAVSATPLESESRRAAPLAPAEAFAAWLGSGSVAGVGPATAQRVALALGERAEEYLVRFAVALGRKADDVQATSVLSEAFGWDAALKGGHRPTLSRQAVERIAAQVAAHAKTRKTVTDLLALGVPLDAALALERAHAERALGEWRREPHAALMAAKGWGFRRVDARQTARRLNTRMELCSLRREASSPLFCHTEGDFF